MSSGLRFGRYEALFRIAAGGMAEIFAARVRGEAGFEKLVAVKRILPHLAQEEGFTEMFLDEARVAANITSPHVVQTLDVGRTEDGAPYLVMELVPGIDLSRLQRASARDGLPLEVATEIVAQAAVGLHDAHEARTAAGRPMQLVHRDISPQNLLVGIDGRVRVTDFGIAWVALERLTETETGALKGKYAYFSPEQSRREALDRRSDLFALGIVAWEALAGRRLFGRDDVIATIEAVRHGEVPSLPDVRPDVPRSIDAVVRRALARAPEERFATGREMADALRRAARAEGREPADGAVAAYVASLELPQVADLLERLKEVARAPHDTTRADGPEAQHGGEATVALPPREVPPATPARRGPMLATLAGALFLIAAGIVAAGAAIARVADVPVGQEEVGAPGAEPREPPTVATRDAPSIASEPRVSDEPVADEPVPHTEETGIRGDAQAEPARAELRAPRSRSAARRTEPRAPGSEAAPLSGRAPAHVDVFLEDARRRRRAP